MTDNSEQSPRVAAATQTEGTTLNSSIEGQGILKKTLAFFQHDTYTKAFLFLFSVILVLATTIGTQWIREIEKSVEKITCQMQESYIHQQSSDLDEQILLATTDEITVNHYVGTLLRQHIKNLDRPSTSCEPTKKEKERASRLLNGITLYSNKKYDESFALFSKDSKDLIDFHFASATAFALAKSHPRDSPEFKKHLSAAIEYADGAVKIANGPTLWSRHREISQKLTCNAHNYRLELTRNANNISKSQECLKAMLGYRGNTALLFNIAETYSIQGKHQEAIEYLRRAIEAGGPLSQEDVTKLNDFSSTLGSIGYDVQLRDLIKNLPVAR